MIRKTISLDEEAYKKAKFLLEKHKGNFSAAVKELIDFASSIHGKNGSLEKALQKDICLKEKFIEKGRGVIVPLPILRWLVENSRGRIPERGVIEEALEYAAPTADPEELKKLLREMGWPLEIHIANHTENGGFAIKIHGPDPVINEFSASLAALFLAKQRLKVVKVKNMGSSIETAYIECDGLEEAYANVLEYLGGNQELFEAILGRPEYWKDIVDVFELCNYNFVFLSKECFEELARGEPLSGRGLEYLLTLKTGKLIRELPLQEFLHFFSNVCQLSGIVDRIDFNDREIRVHHSYRDERVVDWLEKSLMNILKKTGHSFEPRQIYRIIMFKIN